MQAEQYCTPAGSLIYSNSRVHGNRTLYAEAGPYHYKLLLLIFLFRVFFLAGESRRGTRRHILLIIITTYYYTMMQQLLLHCYFIALYKLLADSLLVLQDSSEDASLR